MTVKLNVRNIFMIFVGSDIIDMEVKDEIHSRETNVVYL